MYKLLMLLFAVVGAVTFQNVAYAKSANFEALHNQYMQQSSEYKQADAELNEAWRTLKGLCSKDEFKEELQEQRNWLKSRSDLLEWQKPGEAGMLKILRDRIAILNLKIATRNPRYVTFSVDRELVDGDECIVTRASRHIAMNKHSCCVEKKSQYKFVNDYLFSECRKEITKVIKDKTDLLSDPIDYVYQGKDPDNFFQTTRYNVEFENQKFVSISAFHSGNIGLERAYYAPGKSVYFDVKARRQIEFSDFFKEPALAIVLSREIAKLKIIAAGIRVGTKYEANDVDEIDRHNRDYAYIKDGAVYMPFDKELKIRFGDILGEEAEAYFEYPPRASIEDLRAAEPKEEYFK